MGEVLVFYATTEGQTRRIAEFMAGVVREEGLEGRAIDVTTADADAIDWGRVDAVALAASVHAGHHQPVAEAFARRHLAELSNRPSLFVSVSLSICSRIPDEVAAARRLAEALPERVGWRPMRVACVAGRLAYTQYGFLMRWMMRRIAAKSGGPTDTSRDYDLTDWQAVRELTVDLAMAACPVRTGSGVY